jgi:hypothetical protein
MTKTVTRRGFGDKEQEQNKREVGRRHEALSISLFVGPQTYVLRSPRI